MCGRGAGGERCSAAHAEASVPGELQSRCTCEIAVRVHENVADSSVSGNCCTRERGVRPCPLPACSTVVGQMLHVCK